ncbi:unnamed protein product [Amoebophrya sp. A25]|nr:unnamed protein product [Amoebophrya sp. A25]|eukprot:GSA25T00002641001.1
MAEAQLALQAEQIARLTAQLAAANTSIQQIAGDAHVAQFQRQAAEEAGLGIPTAAQKTQLQAATRTLDYGCTAKEFLFTLRCFDNERMEDVTSPPAGLIWDPLSFVAVVCAVGLVTDDQARTIQKMVVKELAGPLKPRRGASTTLLTRADIFKVFFDTVDLVVKRENRPTVTAGDNQQQRSFSRAFTVNLPVFWQNKLEAKKALTFELAELKRFQKQEMDQAIKSMRAEMLKRPAPGHLNHGDPPLKRPTTERPTPNGGGGSGSKPQDVCLQWMKGSCSSSSCKNAHAGDLSKLSFLNNRFRLGLQEAQIVQLAQIKNRAPPPK